MGSVNMRTKQNINREDISEYPRGPVGGGGDSEGEAVDMGMGSLYTGRGAVAKRNMFGEKGY